MYKYIAPGQGQNNLCFQCLFHIHKYFVRLFFSWKGFPFNVDLAVKSVKVITGSWLSHMFLCSSLDKYMSHFVAIGSAVPEKKIFEGFFLHMGMVAILVV